MQTQSEPLDEGRWMKKRKRNMGRRQEVVAETIGFVIRRCSGDATAPSHALPEASSTTLLSSLFFIRQP